MHSTRIAAFLLGAWMAWCLCLDAMAIQNIRFTGRFLNSLTPQASAIGQVVGSERASLLIRHFVAEQSRYYFSAWNFLQLPVAAIVAGFVYFAVEKRLFAPGLVGFMLLLVTFQAFFITPELNFRGREVDFPPASLSVGQQARVWALTQVFIGAEAAKLVIGVVLAGFLFTYRTRVRVRGSEHNLEFKQASLGR